MYDDTIIEKAKHNLRGPNGTFPVAARRKYVELYLSSQPISKTEFCRQHGFSIDAFRRWLRRYGPSDKDAAPVSKETQSPSSIPVDSSGSSVTIPYSEYLSLLQIKAKYDVIRAISQ